ncbi:hypothetical protein [Candidatus Nitronereus thalassa]|uniref:Uncharacterized protein n=1 Tax=Candidatus Nitronereus thalassa TaxID=3020898 RepID=A0ABU3K366_9BACT|nr:hypothetical protein [Candidatus Nitronereus thalassa]MDT7040840.1 hypothetical protein [Candidatus Nitronereus thalassa]
MMTRSLFVVCDASDEPMLDGFADSAEDAVKKFCVANHLTKIGFEEYAFHVRHATVMLGEVCQP